MNYRLREILTTKYREFSRISVLLGAVLFTTLVVAAFVDLDAVLRFFHVIRGSPSAALETGAFISIVSAVPFLAMGMSISADGYRNK